MTLLLMLPILFGVVSAEEPCTISWDGGGDGVLWANPLNWNPDALPGESDKACIDATPDANVLSATPVSVRLLGVGDTLTIAAGTFTVRGGGVAGTLNLTGGELVGGLVVGGSLNWSGGTLRGPEGTTVQGVGRINITGASDKSLDNGKRILIDGGFVTLADGGNLLFTTNSGFDNYGTFVFAGDGDLLFSGAPYAGAFKNAARIKKTGGAGTSAIGVSFSAVFDDPNNQQRSIHAETGTIDFTAAGSMKPSVAYHHVLQGAGVVRLSGDGDVGEMGVWSGGTLELAGNQIIGRLFVGGTLRWTGGQAGSPQIQANATLDIDGTRDKQLAGNLYNLGGTINLRGTGNIVLAGSLLVNRGDFVINSDASILAPSGSGALINDGSVAKVAGTAATEIAELDNRGTVDVSSGEVNVRSMGTQFLGGSLRGGAYQVFAPGRLRLNGDIVTSTASILLDGTNAQILNTGGGNALTQFATNIRPGRFEVRNGAGLTTSGAFRNEGDVVIGESSTLQTTGDFVQVARSTALQSSTSRLVASGGTVRMNGGLLHAAGTIAPALENSGGIVAPGLSVGTLTVEGPYTQGSGGTLTVAINGSNPGTDSDLLLVSGQATLDGTLSVSTTLSPSLGESFGFMTYPGRVGEFATLTGNDLGNGTMLTAQYEAAEARLVVVEDPNATPSPTATPTDSGTPTPTPTPTPTDTGTPTPTPTATPTDSGTPTPTPTATPTDTGTPTPTPTATPTDSGTPTPTPTATPTDSGTPTPTPTPTPTDTGTPTQPWYLHGKGATSNPGILSLDTDAPTSSKGSHVDSPALRTEEGNTWRTVGTWPAAPGALSATLSDLDPLHVWLGLRDGLAPNEERTRVDVLAQILRNGEVVGEGLVRCIGGLSRSPSKSVEMVVPLDMTGGAVSFGAGDVLALRILGRMGTRSDDAHCGSVSSTPGLRVNFDSTERAARFDTAFSANSTMSPAGRRSRALLPIGALSIGLAMMVSAVRGLAEPGGRRGKRRLAPQG